MNTIFRPEWKKAISMLEPLDRLAVYEAIVDYSDTGEIPVMGVAASVAFEFMRSTIDKDREVYNARCERNRSNGSMGGRPRMNDNPNEPTETQENPENPVGFLETQENPENHNNKCNCKSNCKSNRIKENNIKETIKEKIDLEAVDATAVAPDRPKAESVEWFRELFNEVCVDLPKVKSLNDDRRKRIRLRLSEMKKHGVPEDIARLVFQKMQQSSFVRGSSWASFDWVIKNEGNWVKVYEGNYDDRAQLGTGYDINKHVNDIWDNDNWK